MDKIHTIIEMVLGVLCGTWLVYSIAATRKALKSFDEYDD